MNLKNIEGNCAMFGDYLIWGFLKVDILACVETWD
jgi:hypothetical protein